ncbi:tol-pal system protein YbgF [Agaribacter flavus]|uniref:Cell division coordinator CpoB n=1 Tax=Agaribacter flavus TaxID=1902781 RepID=A0ABV7FKZ7_9ALTE
MHRKLVSTLVLSIMSGVCLAQAPVVDISDTTTPSTSTSSLSDVDVSAVEERLAVLERIVESRTSNQQRMQEQLDILQSDVDGIRGSIELHNHQLEKILERQRELFLEIDNRFSALQTQSQQVASQFPSGINNNSGTTATQLPSSPVAGNEQSAYQNAVNLILKQRDYEAAIPAFRTFLTQFPNSEYTDNAYYWLGQLLYNKKEWSEAKNAFEQVVNNFTQSPKRADSILKLGMIAKQSGDLSTANQQFQKVVAEYPDSTPARLANEQLAGN